MNHPLYRFRDFTLDPAARELRQGAEPVELPTSAFDCLVYLVERRERAVGRDELMAAIWGRADVADGLLGQTLVRVRRVLGDTGNEQHTIRTVPRFGYRFVAPVDEELLPAVAVAPSPTPLAVAVVAPEPEPVAPPIETIAARAIATPAPRRRAAWPAALGLALVAVVAAALWFLRTPAPVVTATGAPVPPALTTPALVLPAVVEAGEDWAWLRLGLMDLVAARLRRGQLATAASESVVALVRDRGAVNPEALLDASDIAGSGTLRILPSVDLGDGRWTVKLTARGGGNDLVVEARAADAIAAAREAVDTLLLRLGHRPPVDTNRPQGLDELMQRTRAAMLADRLDLAGELIRDADPALRDRPEVGVRQAQIELRAGAYDAVEARVSALLDRLSAQRDAALRGRALTTLATSDVRRGRPEAAAPRYAEAITLLTGRGEPDALGAAYLGRGTVAILRDDYQAALADLGLARTEMDAAGDALGVAQVDLNLGVIEARRQRPAQAVAALQEAATRLARLGARAEYLAAVVAVAELQQDLLEPAAALATTDAFWPPEAQTPNPRVRWKLALVRGEALAENGRLRDAQALVDRVATESDPEDDAPVRAQFAALGARLALARGDATAAAQLAAASLTPLLEKTDVARYLRAWTTRLAALRKLGDRTLAANETARFRAWLQTQQPSDWRHVYGTVAAAEQLRSEGRRDEALEVYAQALARADELAVTPADLVEVIRPYSLALLEAGQFAQARALSSRISRWADSDLRAASVFVALNAALNQSDALQQAQSRAQMLAGERELR